MGRTAPPFMYDPPSQNRFSGISDCFDPKAVTRKSWAPREPRMERKGPLVNFNQHPDSYAVLPDGKINKKTMSPKTKSRVKYTRIFQLILRVFTLIGGLAMLFCVICIDNTAGALTWMIRVAPSVSIPHTIYAIYHLGRSSTARTPASSASYMLFASILDAGLIPLFVFTGIIARVEHTSRTYGWGTLFGTKFAADTIIYATFLGCCVTAGLHVASFVISLYLAVIFRKISKLPPDMNPLEDYLTSRSHTCSKSDITDISEKRISDITIEPSNFYRGCLVKEPLITPTRSVRFMHTRADSVEDSGDSTRQSFYSAQSHRYSRSDLPSQQARQYEQSQHTPVAIARTAARGRGGIPSRSQSAIISTPLKSESSRSGSPEMPSRDPSGVSSLSNDNWCVHHSSPFPPLHADRVSPLPHHQEYPDMMGKDIGTKDWEDAADSYGFDRSDTVVRYRSKDNYSPLSCYYDDDESIYSKEHTENLYIHEHDLGDKHGSNKTHQGGEDDNKTLPVAINPLEMNPPTPQPAEQQQLNSYGQTDSTRRLALTDVPNPSLNRPEHSMPVNYQCLAEVEPRQEKSSPFDINNRSQTPNGLTPKDDAKNSTSAKKRWTLIGSKPSAYESIQADDDSDDGHYASPAPRDSDRKGRVVSNSGIDLGLGFGSGSPGYGNYIAGLGVGRRRDVSGKVAEEGRGGGVSVVDEEKETPTKPKGRRLSKAGGGEIKAAGWARFKGL
ncbi:hypothetical protein AJ78_02012 [Emergomyces pasteurianus Ep9510]|uniref:Uncharacterized protein n=1 Tax=Emergomyces pasteurianus Ep9510 TaxID=1447872 RepID=A0A1J9QCG0_9EURO|nr:hypothetical protein AJ78_02012 [Emergomyces pasteurianus Ep9510]